MMMPRMAAIPHQLLAGPGRIRPPPVSGAVSQASPIGPNPALLAAAAAAAAAGQIPPIPPIAPNSLNAIFPIGVSWLEHLEE